MPTNCCAKGDCHCFHHISGVYSPVKCHVGAIHPPSCVGLSAVRTTLRVSFLDSRYSPFSCHHFFALWHVIHPHLAMRQPARVYCTTQVQHFSRKHTLGRIDVFLMENCTFQAYRWYLVKFQNVGQWHFFFANYSRLCRTAKHLQKSTVTQL